MWSGRRRMSAPGQARSFAEVLADGVRAWDRFWFRPADPTTPGLMRICCGLMLLYIRLAYTFDLQTFVGSHARFDLQPAHEFRSDLPPAAPPTGCGPRPPAPAAARPA